MNDSDTKKRITITFQPTRDTMERLQKAEQLSALTRTELINLAIPLGLDDLEPHGYSNANYIRSLKTDPPPAPRPALLNEPQEGNAASCPSIPAAGARAVKYPSARTRNA
jgi:hypothetical protein